MTDSATTTLPDRRLRLEPKSRQYLSSLAEKNQMGLLKVGHPLAWDESKKHSKYVREHGVTQFLNTWLRVKDIRNDVLKYGEEIEVGVFLVDKANGTLKVSARAPEVWNHTVFALFHAL